MIATKNLSVNKFDNLHFSKSFDDHYLKGHN